MQMWKSVDLMLIKRDKTLLLIKDKKAGANIITKLKIETSVSKVLDNFFLGHILITGTMSSGCSSN